MRESSDGGLTPEELATLGPGSGQCRCGHWDTVHGFFCMAEWCDCGEFTRAGEAVTVTEEDLNAPVVSSRFFRWDEVDWPWWKPLCLVGWRGGDENCNRTLGVRWGHGAWFICLNVPLRQQPCDECRELTR